MNNDTKKYLVLVDGHAIAFRSYFALSRAGSRTKDGFPTWAIFGFTRVLIEIIESFKPEYIIMTFDTGEPTFRHEMYDAYKGNRSKAEDDFIIQMPYIVDMVKAFNIPIYQKAGYEADDLIGTLAKKAVQEGFEVDIITGDQDLMQLVDENTSVFLPNREAAGLKKYCTKDVIEKYGVTPAQIVDYKAIKGDPSDNIPGVKGIGEKGASKLIQDFGSLENIYENLTKVDKERTRNLLLESKENAFLSKKLATIHVDSPVEFDVNKAILEKPDEEVLRELLKKLEFRTILENLTKIFANYDNKLPDEEDELWFDFKDDDYKKEELDLNVKIVSSLEKLENLVETLKKKDFFAIDLETDNINALIANIVGISIAYRDNEEQLKAKDFNTFYIPVDHKLIEDLEKNLPLDKTIALFKPLLENPLVKKIGHNLKYEINVFSNYDVILTGLQDDTFISDYVVDPSKAHGLKDIAKNTLNYNMTNIVELIGKGKNLITIDQVSVDTVGKYAGADSAVSLELSFFLRDKLKATEMLDLYEKIELPLVEVLAKMERTGINVDNKHLTDLSKKIEGQLKELEIKIYELAGKEFNINSPKQLSTILFEDLQISPKGVKKNKTTGYSTDVGVLEKLAGEYQIVKEIMEYRLLTKIKSTYSDSISELINKKTGKIHTSFNQGLTTTGRLSSNTPNLQNIPIKTELGREIRRAFIPSNENNVILSADYSQIELRLLAHYTEDPVFMESFKNNLDIHSKTIMDIYGIENIEDVTPELRRVGKTVNFGIVYGQTAFGLSESLKISMSEASMIIKKFNAKYISITKYVDDMTYFATSHGYVKTLFNRRRYLPDIYSTNRSMKEFAKRNAINTPLQGSASDIIKLAMLEVDKELTKRNLNTKMLLQVHDELVFEVPKEELDSVKELVKTKMEGVFPEMKVHLNVSINIGNSWVEAK